MQKEYGDSSESQSLLDGAGSPSDSGVRTKCLRVRTGCRVLIKQSRQRSPTSEG